MKLLINYIDDLTDSREMLESKPHHIIYVFILLLISFIIVIITWAYFGEVDEYVNSQGIVRPDESICKIKNIVTGKVNNVLYVEGKMVKAGDLLFSIDHQKLDLEYENIRADFLEMQKEYDNMILLRKSVQDNKNYLDNNNRNEEYYNKYIQYEIDLKYQIQQIRNININVDQLHNNTAYTQEEIFVNKYKADYIVNLDSEISSLKKNLKENENECELIKLSINECYVRSPIDGVVNIISEISRDEFLQSGEQIVNIVPESNPKSKVQFYISNKDIANIKKGQSVKFHFLALPYTEYGALKGKITNIGSDTIIQRDGSSSSYLVEAELDADVLYSYKGDIANIKVGMMCEVQVIIRTKKIIHQILEKLNLMD